MEQAGQEIQSIACSLNPFYNAFVGNNVCNKRNIYTSGISTDVPSCRDLRPIGFCNSPHKDGGDYIHSKAVEYFKGAFANTLEGSKYGANFKKKAEGALEMLTKNTGALGVPTTCGHQTFIGQKSGTVSGLHASFGMFDFALPIQDKTVHHFYGWAFRHCTIVPFWMIPSQGSDTEVVRFFNSVNDAEEDIIVLAWGRTGGRKETEIVASAQTRG